MSAVVLEKPVIRAMSSADLKEIIEIDVKVLGKPRPKYWDRKLDTTQKRSRVASLVAELDGKVVGFIIGGASGGEYGVDDNVGWVDTIGVDPDYQRRGIARMLFQEMAANLKAVGVDKIYTFVKRLDWKMLKYFNKMGFEKGEMLNLEVGI